MRKEKWLCQKSQCFISRAIIKPHTSQLWSMQFSFLLPPKGNCISFLSSCLNSFPLYSSKWNSALLKKKKKKVLWFIFWMWTKYWSSAYQWEIRDLTLACVSISCNFFYKERMHSLRKWLFRSLAMQSSSPCLAFSFLLITISVGFWPEVPSGCFNKWNAYSSTPLIV